MDALDILARIDDGQPVTHEELGYLLPELERRGHIKVERVERHCKKIFARTYRYRGRQFLWAGGHLGNYQTGIAPVPAAACEITPDLKTPTFLAVTTCRKCRCGLVLAGGIPGLGQRMRRAQPRTGRCCSPSPTG
jgi:hypothetical protein